ncbi:hypothetical protein N9948_00350 [bacterium]|nr:hypothetical protein [bacterium]
MKKYKIEYTIEDIDFIFKLASIGHLDLFNCPELIKLRRGKYSNSIFHIFCSNLRVFPEEKQKIVIDYILGFKGIEDFKDYQEDTPLHVLGRTGRLEVLDHPLMNVVQNASNETPYCLLLEKVPMKKLGDCIIPEEVLKVLADRGYLGPAMPLDSIERRSRKPTLGQLKGWGIPILQEGKSSKKRITYNDVSEFKRNNNSLRFILS